MVPELKARGVELLVIGNGPEWAIDGFREKSGFEGPIYTDPERHAYRALRLRRDKGATLNLGTIKAGIRSFRSGHRQTKTLGDPWQQGGVFVIKAGGDIAWAYRSEFAGDHPSEELVFEAVSAL